MEFDQFQISNCILTISVSDIITRFSYPLVANTLKLSGRNIFLIGVAGLGVMRLILVHADIDYKLVLIICVAFGFFRALTVVNHVMILVEFCEGNCTTKLPGTLG